MSQEQNHKWVYLFEEGSGDDKELLGGKGAGLAEMTRAGLPVPPGFVVTTEACNAFYANNKQFIDNFIPAQTGLISGGTYFTFTKTDPHTLQYIP